MFNGKYTSLREIIYRVKRHPLMADANFSDMALDVLDIIRSIGAPMAYESIIKYIPIENYRAILPSNLFYIERVDWITPTNNIPMQYAPSNSGGNWNCISAAGKAIESTYTYSVKRNYIYTDIESGSIGLHYKALVMDEDGNPMVPDNISLIRAIENYVKLQHFLPKHDLGEIPNHTISRLERDYMWYIGQAENALKMPDVDEMETIRNSLVRFIPNYRAHLEEFDYESLSRVR